MALIKKLRLSLLLELFFDTSLLLLFITQAFIVGCLFIYGYLPIPASWGNQLIAQKMPPGLILEVEDYRLRLGGAIELIDIELRSEDIQLPLMDAESAELELAWSSPMAPPHAKSLVVSAGTLFIPSVYSPDGHHRPILNQATFRLTPQQDILRIDHFAALHDTIHLRGAFDIPIRQNTSQDLAVSKLIHELYTQAAKLSQQKQLISYFKSPTIAFKLTLLDDKNLKADLNISSQSLLHPEVTAEKVQLSGRLKVQNGHIEPLNALRLTAQRLDIPRYKMAADSLSAEIAPDQLSTLISGAWPQLKLSAQRIELQAFELDAPILRIDPIHYPEITFNGATRNLNSAIDLEGTINAQLWSGRLRARGSVDLLSLIPEKASAKIPKTTFKTAPYYDLYVQFDPSFTLKHAEIQAQVRQLQVEDLSFEYISAHASYKDAQLSIEDLYLRRQQQWLDLKFTLDTKSQDYKLSLFGSAVPYEYNALLPRWWAAIFKDFDFSQTTDSLGDFIIYGNAKRKVADLYFGHAKARNVSYMDVALDSGQLIVRGRGRYCELEQIDAYSTQGWARGKVAFTSKSDEIKGPASIRLDMQAQLTLEDAAKLFKGNVANIIADFQTDGLPLTTLEAAIFNNQYSEYAGKSYFDLSANSPEPLTYKGIPLEKLSFDLYGRTEISYLRNLKFGYSEGQASADIDVFTPKNKASSLRYQFTLKNADQNKALQNLPRLDQLEKSLEAKEDATKEEADITTARLELNLHGEGPTQDPFQHKGFGLFEIRNEQLGSIQLLGPLSRILQNTQLNFTTLNLKTMQGDFTYLNEDVHFDPLRIDGALTQINAPGTLNLKDQSLDMRVNVSLFANAGNPDSNLRRLRDLITKPIPNPLQFELTGTLQNQQLRSLYDPRNLIPNF